MEVIKEGEYKEVVCKEVVCKEVVCKEVVCYAEWKYGQEICFNGIFFKIARWNGIIHCPPA